MPNLRFLMTRKVVLIDPVGCKAGMDLYNNGLIDALQRKKVSCKIYSNYDDPRVETKKVFGIGSSFTSKIYYLLIGIIKSFFLIKNEAYPIVILHFFSFQLKDYFLFRIIHFSGVRIITIFHDIETLGETKINVFQKKIAKESSAIIVHNYFSKDELSAKITLGKDKIYVIKHGINTTEKRIVQESNYLKKGKNEFWVLFFGQIKSSKGLDILIESFKYIREDNIRLVIAGKPWQINMKYFYDLIRTNSLSNKVLMMDRFISNNEKVYLFQSSDLVILPYKKIYQSGVLLNVMAHRKPIIVSDLEPFKEIIDDYNNGLIFKTNDPIDLSKKILELYFDRNLAISLGNNGFKTVESNYNWDVIAEEYLHLFEHLDYEQ